MLLIDKDTREKFGGLAKESFGGIHLVDTPQQRRLGIRDSPELAWRDWQSVADYEPGDQWPRAWGQFYCENSIEYIFEFLHQRKIAFLPVVNWPERGIYVPGNSVPRWHIVWGTGYEIIHRLLEALSAHPRSEQPGTTLRYRESPPLSWRMAGPPACAAGDEAAAMIQVRAEHVS